MKIGIVARGEDRGLGLQTWEACRHLNPAKVLLVEPRMRQRAQFPMRYERFREFDTTRVEWNGGDLPVHDVITWLDGLDVVYTAETFYDRRMPAWCADLGVGAVCHANPEFYNEAHDDPAVTWWSATSWRLAELPTATRVVPMPVATDRFAPTADAPRSIRFLHVAGHAAHCDRNGTDVVAEALPRMRSGARWTILTQDNHTNVDATDQRVRIFAGGFDNYWELYQHGNVLVMPRRFGGLCLPVQEAMAAGLPVVMTDISPNETWPGPRFAVHATRDTRMPCGVISIAQPDPADLAACLDDLTVERLPSLRDEALSWAAAHSWDALRPRWLEELARACRSR